ncbi:hypothetical protein FB645_002602 [Coemansia sp. IMI 203386]|nr:hypothetical protein FB645_002602 [Coemansia sp. IMI 203386]
MISPNMLTNGFQSFEALSLYTDATTSVSLAYEVDGLTISTEANFARVADDINEQINVVRKNVQQIEKLHTEAIYATSPFKHSQVLRSREQYAKDNGVVIASIKTSIQVLGHAATDPHIAKSDRAMRANRHIALCRRFLEQINAYRKMEREQADKNRDRLVRLLNIACPDVTDSEILDAIENDTVLELMETKLPDTCGPGETRKITKDVNDRIGDITNINHNINELAQLSIELNDIVNRQQAKLDTITVSVERVQTRINSGLTEKDYSLVSRSSFRRRRKWAILILMVLIIGIVLGTTLGVLKSQGKI